jgi:hypothetical protein
MNQPGKYTAFVGGKKISLIAFDESLLNKQIFYLQGLYEKISLDSGNKLDRESIFLFIALKIINERESSDFDLCSQIDFLISDINSIITMINK